MRVVRQRCRPFMIRGTAATKPITWNRRGHALGRRQCSSATDGGRVVYSGIQPTGQLHIGNYLGAVCNWLKVQEESNANDKLLYCSVDMHAYTSRPSGSELSKNNERLLATMIACGLDPKRCIIYTQSTVPEHAELSWILSCHTAMGDLRRQTQYKSKATQQGRMLGLFAYPVVMAADVLLYGTTHVPVGEDQVQHLELTRSIARSFNHHYDVNVFTEPETLLTPSKRILSLRDGTAKMSKSATSDKSRIHMMDSDDDIRLKIRKAVTDALPQLTYDPAAEPCTANLIDIYAGFEGVDVEQVLSRYPHVSTKQAFKQDLADLIVAKLSPIRNEVQRLESDPEYMQSVMRDGAMRARELATHKMDQLRQLIGFPCIH